MIQVHIEVYINGEIIIHFQMWQTIHQSHLKVLQYPHHDLDLILYYDIMIMRYGFNNINEIIQVIEIYGEECEMNQI